MAGKKVTIKDVAREAGVSVATVSYVVNGRTDLRISDETRKKVLHVINLLNYSPNQTAKALASNKKSLIAFSTSDNNNNVLKLSEEMHSINVLASFFHENGYELLLVHPSSKDNYSQAAAILCMDMEKSDFQKLGENNFIPLLSVNGFINDPLFFQINDDIDKIKNAASYRFNSDYTFVTLTPNNDERMATIKKQFKKVAMINSLEDLKKLPDNIVTTDYIINEMLAGSRNCLYIDSLSKEKCSLILRSIEQAVDREPITDHDLYI
ncbi:regulatory protein, lacI family [Pseudobutyrivibrio sp. YE44]|uniref:LacI family DNA-binding transcriptional regulator n=1 Tax=Pseudobutyrivibrio sp. YE44 TaxID=1520802 RepID=UPI0008840E87|nr:LacI family DNA-binding transcriptional regulator [Pseudobutyrivibrio sp. YE44]SDB30941.1 regulatory protein, lacI family [Pseudobutyrivibrio sp. YE44]